MTWLTGKLCQPQDPTVRLMEKVSDMPYGDIELCIYVLQQHTSDSLNQLLEIRTNWYNIHSLAVVSPVWLRLLQEFWWQNQHPKMVYPAWYCWASWTYKGTSLWALSNSQSSVESYVQRWGCVKGKEEGPPGLLLPPPLPPPASNIGPCRGPDQCF